MMVIAGNISINTNLDNIDVGSQSNKHNKNPLKKIMAIVKLRTKAIFLIRGSWATVERFLLGLAMYRQRKYTDMPIINILSE